MSQMKETARGKKPAVLLTLAVCLLGFLWLSGCSKTKRRADKGSGETRAETASQQIQSPAESEAPKGPNPPTDGGLLAKPIFSAEDRAQVGARLEKMGQALEESKRISTRESFDPPAIVDKVGKEPMALLGWVKDNITFVPYQGSLRGAAGVLVDRVANSLDVALLMADLLKRAGHEFRLARGELDEEKIRAIMSRQKPSRPGALSGGEEIQKQEADLDRAAAQLEINPDSLRQTIRAEAKSARDDAGIAGSLIKEQKTMILKTLGDWPVSKGNPDASTADCWRQHWWVQIKQDDQWVDLDPVLAEAQPGKGAIEAKSLSNLDGVDEGLFHALTIRLIIEHLEEGQLKEDIAFEKRFKAPDLLGKTICLEHFPLSWQELSQEISGDELAALLKKHHLEKTEWLPVLSLGSESLIQSSFTDSGQINKNPMKKKSGGGVGGLMGGLSGAFGGGRKEAEAVEKSTLTAEWLEFRIEIPGQIPEAMRMAVFDLIGPAARAAGTFPNVELPETEKVNRGLRLMGYVDILPLVAQPSTDFVHWKMIESLAGGIQDLQGRLRIDEILKPQDLLVSLWEMLGNLQNPALAWSLARREWNEQGQRTYLDSLNLAAGRRYFLADGNGKIRLNRTFDIIRNQVATYPGERDLEPIITQGIADTVAEGLLGAEPESRLNLNEIYKSAQAQGVNWQKLDKPMETKELGFVTPDTQAQIRQDLNDGYLVILPAQPVLIDGRQQTAWWRINQSSGHTIGILESGLHGDSATERSIWEWKTKNLMRKIFGRYNPLKTPSPAELRYYICLSYDQLLRALRLAGAADKFDAAFLYGHCAILRALTGC